MTDSGGFVKGDSDTPSKKAGGDGPKSRAQLPVHTNQIAKLVHPSLGLVLHRHKFAHVTVVGFISDYVNTENKMEFRINDSFGSPVLVQLWKGGEDENNGSSRFSPSLQNDALVRVCGVARKNISSPEPLILANRVMPLTDLNELTTHHLDVIDSILTLRKRKDNVCGSIPEVTGFPGSQLKTEPSFNDTFSNITMMNNSMSGAAASSSVAGSQSKADPNDLVLRAITKDESVQGISLVDLEKSLKQLDIKKIRAAIDYLQNEGHIYTTTDENHYKSTDGN